MSTPWGSHQCATHGHTLFMQRWDAEGRLLYSCQACAKAEGFYEAMRPQAEALRREALRSQQEAQTQMARASKSAV